MAAEVARQDAADRQGDDGEGAVLGAGEEPEAPRQQAEQSPGLVAAEQADADHDHGDQVQLDAEEPRPSQGHGLDQQDE